MAMSQLAKFLGVLFQINLQILSDLDNPIGFSNFYLPDFSQPYDFIVVGGGIGGSVVAARLSENPRTRVLLIEAGNDGSWVTNFHMGGLFVAHRTDEFMYNYEAESEATSCLGFEHKRCLIGKGKVLGGGSSINAMLWVRGNKKDYDEWEREGNKGWGYQDLLPFMKKSENVLPEYLRANSQHRGTGGPVEITTPSFTAPLTRIVLDAGEELGYRNGDYNADNQTGFFTVQLAKGKKGRMSSATAYLKPLKKRSNLEVVLLSKAVKILVNKNKEAYGVEFIRNGAKYTAISRKEVIISAGAIETPKVLKLSGIGPAEELEKLEIPLIQDLPVGENFQNHVGVAGIMFYSEDPIVFTLEDTYKLSKMAFNTYKFLKKERSLFSEVTVNVKGFVHTKYSNDPERPDGEIEVFPYNIMSNHVYLARRNMGLSQEVISNYQPLENKYSFFMKPYISRPKSRGRILLRSADPIDPPKIIDNWFSDPDDIKRTIGVIRVLFNLTKTEAFQKSGIRHFDKPIPGCETLSYGSDDYWECHIRTFSWTAWHDCGTCKMGPRDDPSSVVDDELVVHGMKKLRIVDASVFPNVTTGNIQATVYAVAEKGASLIKEVWGL